MERYEIKPWPFALDWYRLGDELRAVNPVDGAVYAAGSVVVVDGQPYRVGPPATGQAVMFMPSKAH